MKCPRCSATMQERRKRSTGAKFWGCSNYPDCKVTMTPEDRRRLLDLPPESLEEEIARTPTPDDQIPEDLSRDDI